MKPSTDTDIIKTIFRIVVPSDVQIRQHHIMTERKPPGVSFETWVERQLREAAERGEFDNLPGAGKPIPDLDKPRDELWWIGQKLRREQLSSLPPTIALRKEAEDALAAASRAGSEAQVRTIVGGINRKILEGNRKAASGPPLNLAPLDVERVVRGWRETWEGFAGAHTWIAAGDGWWHLVPRPVGAPAPADGADPAGDGSRWHVVTAWNPGGRTAAEAGNRAAARALLADPRLDGLVVRTSFGGHPDGTWLEPGVAVTGLSRGQARELGRAYGQLAVYELAGTARQVVACDSDRVLAQAVAWRREQQPPGPRAG